MELLLYQRRCSSVLIELQIRQQWHNYSNAGRDVNMFDCKDLFFMFFCTDFFLHFSVSGKCFPYLIKTEADDGQQQQQQGTHHRKRIKDQVWLKIFCLNLWGDDRGAKLHNILMILRNRPSAAEDRPRCTSSNGKNKQQVPRLRRVRCCLTQKGGARGGREVKLAAFVAGMKGSMQNNSGNINLPFCSAP